MKRFREFTTAHPLISALTAMLALVLVGELLFPLDPPYVDQAMYHVNPKGSV